MAESPLRFFALIVLLCVILLVGYLYYANSPNISMLMILAGLFFAFITVASEAATRSRKK